MTDRSSAKPNRLLLAGGIVAGVLLSLTIWVWMFGQVRGEEFNPYTWDLREFNYTEVPGLRMQVRKVRRTAKGSNVVLAIKNGAWFPASTSPSRWDLVSGARTAVPQLGDAAILTKYFDARDASRNFYWEAWTTAHPLLAAELWPVVVWLARQELYVVVPDMMELARGKQASQAATLRSELDATLVSRLADVAKMLEQQGDAERAAKVRQWAEATQWRVAEGSRPSATAEAATPEAELPSADASSGS